MSLAQLNAQIAASRERLKELYRQRDAITSARRWNKRPRNIEMLRLFDDDGLGAAAIARKMELPNSLVRQFLSSRGRTKSGREMARSQLAAMAETQR